MVKIFLVVVIIASNAFGIMYRDINIEEMRDQSDMIFSGVVTAENAGVINHKPYIETTFKVVKWYGTNAKKEVSIRQFANKGASGKMRVFPGLPVFTKGQVYLVFLPTANADGFASPTGLLTFSLFAKNIDKIKNASHQVKAVPNRITHGLYANIQSTQVKALLSGKRSAIVYKKAPISLDILDQIIMEAN